MTEYCVETLIELLENYVNEIGESIISEKDLKGLVLEPGEC